MLDALFPVGNYLATWIFNGFAKEFDSLSRKDVFGLEGKLDQAAIAVVWSQNQTKTFRNKALRTFVFIVLLSKDHLLTHLTWAVGNWQGREKFI